MIRLLFIIRAFDRGGAQRQLIQLVAGLDPNRFAITVVTFYDGGDLRPEIEVIDGVNVLSLHKKGRWDFVLPALRLLSIARDVKPAIVHGYMDLANLLSLVVGKVVGSRVVWG